MSILKELNELAAKYSEDYEKEATIEGAIDAVDKSLESALGTLGGDIEDLQDLAYGENGTPADPAEGSILDRIGDLEENPGILIVGITQTGEGVGTVVALDKTWQEIHDAPCAFLVAETSSSVGDDVLPTLEKNISLVTVVMSAQDGYSVATAADTFVSLTSDGYPILKTDDAN